MYDDGWRWMSMLMMMMMMMIMMTKMMIRTMAVDDDDDDDDDNDDGDPPNLPFCKSYVLGLPSAAERNSPFFLNRSSFTR